MRTYVKVVIIFSFLLAVSVISFYRPFSAEAQAPTPPTPAPANLQAQFPTNVGLDCAGCHGPGKALPKLGGDKFHKDAHAATDSSIHATLGTNGKRVAGCLDCHAIKGDLSTIYPGEDPRSTINRANITQTCGRCHNNPDLMATKGITNRPYMAYQESVHGKALSQGNLKAAVCSDCHNSHNILPATSGESSISKFNVGQTCGRCHGEIASDFVNSVHGTSLARGNYQSPNCTDCHGIHGIKDQKNNRTALALMSCSQCHDGVRLSDDFGIPVNRVASFQDSYHGRALKLGSDVVADCSSCHGVHNILPSSHPKSLVNKNNLVATCGQCHLGAAENFAIGKVHLETGASTDIGSQGISWVRYIYLFLIIGTIGGMVLHNGLIWYRKAVEKRINANRPLTRMSLNQRIQHWFLMLSFIVLVVTGFALEYPDTWLGWLTGGESVRRLVHRVAAVIMMVGGIYHLLYLALYKEGRLWFWDMFPRWKDVTDLYVNLKHFLLNKGEKPKFARFRYADKAEYWAVIWGTVIMGLTGLIIWFKVDIFGFLPRWAVDIAIAIHFYEAILATLAIIVWHFYHVIFDPDVYPVNWAFYDGKMSEELFKEEHEQAYEDMKAAEANMAAIDDTERSPESDGGEAGLLPAA